MGFIILSPDGWKRDNENANYQEEWKASLRIRIGQLNNRCFLNWGCSVYAGDDHISPPSPMNVATCLFLRELFELRKLSTSLYCSSLNAIRNMNQI